MSAHALPSPFDGKEIWFLTGSQDLYGEETLARVAEQSRQVAAWLDEAEAVPVPIVWKPVLKDRDAIRAAMLAANANDDGADAGPGGAVGADTAGDGAGS